MDNNKNMSETNKARHPAAEASPPGKELKGNQLKEWYKTPETHEQLVVGTKTSRTFAKTLGFLDEMEKKVDGREERVEGGGH